MTDDDGQDHERDRTEGIDTVETDMSAGGTIVETGMNADEIAVPIDIGPAVDEAEHLSLDVVATLALLVLVLALGHLHIPNQKDIITSILQQISAR